MPALYSKYMQWLEVDKTDPITGKPVDVGAIVKVKDPSVSECL